MFGKGHVDFSVLLLAIAALGLTPAVGYGTTGDIPAVQVLNTSPLYADSASYHSCNVVNVTTANIVVSIELISVIGAVDVAATNILVPAGGAVQINDATGSHGSNFPGFARCRFSTSYSAGGIRANETIFAVLPSGNTQTYAVSEAR